MTLINWLLNKKMHVKISTKIFFFNMLNHALYFFIYVNIIFLVLKDLAICKQIKIYFCIFLNKRILIFCNFWRKVGRFNIGLASHSIIL
jgi:hypothetical protein